jgi:tetratricopeptide (TPR) repeat protein
MLVVFPPAIRHDDGIVPSYYEDHLLERVTLLEIRLSQVAERLALALDLMLQQTKNTHSDHLLLETLIDSLNTLGAVEKDRLRQKWHKKVKNKSEIRVVARQDQILEKICAENNSPNPDLFSHLVKEGLKFVSQNEEKQALRTFERALEFSPQNIHLILLVAELLFQADKFEQAQQFLEKGLKIEPENKNILMVLGLIWADSLETDKAKALLGKIKTEELGLFSKNYVLGFMAAFEQDWKSALGFFKSAWADFNVPETNYLIGCVYFQLGKSRLALQHLQKAVEVDTNFADAWFMLSVIYQSVGDETKSYQSIELAWTSKETGAECLKFLKRGKQIEVSEALPFISLKDLKKQLIMGSSIIFTKIIRSEVTQILGS